MKTKADLYFENAKHWKEEILLLREIISMNKLLTEDYKWMHPCYTFKGKNVVLIHGFKHYCGILFYKGALLKDPEGILVQQTDRVQSGRQLRFSNVEEIRKLKPVIRRYIDEAIEIEKSGRKVEMKKVEDYPVAAEFESALRKDPAFKKAFRSLTPGRQKAYLLYFNEAKQSKTRVSRIEKYRDKILDGKGMDD